MSRSNPIENGIPNPATRWFEWNGEQGVIRYYDKDTKKNIDLGSDLTFILLDQLGRVGGWHNDTDSAIYSNEVKDTRQGVLVVKSRKGGTIAEGVYKSIKDRVNAMGGYFVSNCYVAYKDDNGDLVIGSLRFKGSSLAAWMEFSDKHRADLYKKAVRVHGYTEGKKGRITYRTPQFSLVDISPETDKIAVALDAELQAYLKSYFQRTTRDQVDAHQDETPEPEPVPAGASGPPAVDDIPF